MKEVVIKDAKTDKSEYVILHEIRSLSALIAKRTEWLGNPQNKMKNTFKAVLLDTREMIIHLKDLRTEFEDIKAKT